jgi:CelD/BcsL family acetyltransferase involved in cellulose biosynthesis
MARFKQEGMVTIEANREVKVIRSIENIEAVRSIWETLQVHPSSNIDYFLESLKADSKIVAPCVILYFVSDILQAIVAGRIIETKLIFKIGYLPIYKTKGRVLSILEHGVLGVCGDEDARYVVAEIIKLLAQGEADMAHLASLSIDTPIYRSARNLPRAWCRGYLASPEKRWTLHLPGSYQQFLEGLSPKSRSTNLRSKRKLEKIFKNRLQIRVVSNPMDLAATLDEMETVASKTYQRRLGTGFMNSPQERRLLEAIMHHGMLSIDLLYIDKKLAAFCYGLQCNEVYLYETPAYDPEYADYRVGNYILLKLIERLCDDSRIKIIDFGLGDAQYKQVYSNHTSIESHVRIFASSWKGLRLNIARTSIFLFNHVMDYLLKRFSLYDRIKRYVRTRMRN